MKRYFTKTGIELTVIEGGLSPRYVEPKQPNVIVRAWRWFYGKAA